MNLRTLQYFVVLAEELNFSRAAQRLHVAQPALSQQIRGFEKELGTELVDRARRPLRLTEAGSYLLTEARQILAAYDEAVLGAREISIGVRGWLAIGFTRSAMYSVLPPALKAFHDAYPRVKLKLFEMLTEEQASALDEGRIHIGIGREPPPATAGCVTRLVLREPVMAVLSPDHPLAAADEVDIARLAKSPLIIYPMDASAHFAQFVESLYRNAGLAPSVEHRTFEITTALGLVAAGLGVTFVGESVARNGRPDVVYRPIAGLGPAQTTTLGATFRADDRSPHLRAFLDFLPDINSL